MAFTKSCSKLRIVNHLQMVGAAGLEPATVGLEIQCSIRLSYAPSNAATTDRTELIV
jgi:hypothetical protein